MFTIVRNHGNSNHSNSLARLVVLLTDMDCNDEGIYNSRKMIRRVFFSH
uniref:Uncharacterized protein n=1 Tax=Arundo donax TaxID=35708 RepID=A0A0A9FJY4_ARUDO